MKTFIHYLNWALHDFNSLVLNGFLKPYIKMFLIGALFIGVALGPGFIPGMTINLLTVWAFLVIVVSPFIWISYNIYHERRHPTPTEPEVIIEEVTTGMGVSEPAPQPLTVTESMRQGLSWTIYLYGVLIGAAILTAFVGDYFSSAIDYVL